MTKHGMSKAPLYNTWKAMKTRCYNQKDLSYKNYGGRGISVCKSWRDSFEAFYADMGDRPEGMSIDRIDNGGDYKPGNCRWSTPTEQHNNKRTNRLITAYGVKLTVTEWGRYLAIPYNRIYQIY